MSDADILTEKPSPPRQTAQSQIEKGVRVEGGRTYFTQGVRHEPTSRDIKMESRRQRIRVAGRFAKGTGRFIGRTGIKGINRLAARESVAAKKQRLRYLEIEIQRLRSDIRRLRA